MYIHTLGVYNYSWLVHTLSNMGNLVALCEIGGGLNLIAMCRCPGRDQGMKQFRVQNLTATPLPLQNPFYFEIYIYKRGVTLKRMNTRNGHRRMSQRL
jgi:hypothetical protein